MILQIPDILSDAEIKEVVSVLENKSHWQDGSATASGPAGKVKKNIQTRNQAPAIKQLLDNIAGRLASNLVFTSATRPERFIRPSFNAYETGMSYGDHVDSAQIDNQRTDISMTLFLTDPSAYEGGELIIKSQIGHASFKPPAGTVVIYPSTSIHRVDPIRSGKRVSYFGWIKSQVRYPHQREMLFDMDRMITSFDNKGIDQQELLPLINIRNNTMREWAS